VSVTTVDQARRDASTATCNDSIADDASEDTNQVTVRQIGSRTFSVAPCAVLWRDIGAQNYVIMVSETGNTLDRPFYFINVLWGERFRNYFLEYCLPSLLAPGNLPALSTRAPSKFLISTRPEDWEAMSRTPIFRRLADYVEPMFLEIPPCPPNRSGAEHMGQGHKLCCGMAFHERAYAMVLTPDCMLSDGTIARLQELARGGTKLVLAAALRFGEEPFLANLEKLGAVPATSRRDSGDALVISGRQMVEAALNGFHTETLRYEWDAPYFPPCFPGVPAAAWWRVPGEEGIVLHSLSWAPMLLDYAAVREHNVTDLDTWTLDGDYIFQNLGETKEVHISTDSDEMFIASWGPLADRPADLTPRSMFGALGRGAMCRLAFYGPVFNAMKRRMFFRQVNWHARALNRNWLPVETRATRAIRVYLGWPDEQAERSRLRTVWDGFLYLVALLEWSKHLPHAIRVWSTLHHRRLALVVQGDGPAIRWLWWTVRRNFARLAGRRFEEPRPEVPGAPVN
jgi:hypothetical protein